MAIVFLTQLIYAFLSIANISSRNISKACHSLFGVDHEATIQIEATILSSFLAFSPI